MTRAVTISTLQTPWGLSGSDAEIKLQNVDQACVMLEEAGCRGSDIALLPEMFPLISVRLTPASTRAGADEAGGPLCRRLAELARRHRMYVLAPVYACQAGRIFNAVWIFDRSGDLTGAYYKVHPTQGEMANGVTVGDTLPVFTLDCGTVGVMTCHDNSFPETARCLALDGAEVVFWPHVQSGWGDIAWDAVYYRARAIDNHLFLVGACPGTPHDRAWMPGMMVGRSAVVGRDGFPLAEVGRHSGIATAMVDLAEQRLVGSFTRDGEDAPYWPLVLADRRPDAYSALTRPKRSEP